jgi:hypothetical protein
MDTYYACALYLDNEHLYELSSFAVHDLQGYFDLLCKAENNLRMLTGIKSKPFSPVITSRNMSWDLLEEFRKHLTKTYRYTLEMSREQFEALGYTELTYFCNMSFNIINVSLFTVTSKQPQKHVYIKECVV